MELHISEKVRLFCGTIVYSLTGYYDRYTITVKNSDTGEICSVGIINVSSKFSRKLIRKLINGCVTPVTAHDVIRDAVLDAICELRQ